VSVVMPFAGSLDAARAAVEALGRLRVLDGDELLLADNAGVLASARGGLELRASTGTVVAIAGASREQSPAHARNAGAAAASPASEWILFLDADTVAPADLLDRYFAEPIADDVGAVAGGIAAAPVAPSAGIVARYGAHKNFLDAGAHLAHPFMPRAAAANLLVRRAAFDAVGGFFEGLRAAEDTDFSWRLQRAGWTLAGRPCAAVEHRYRESLSDLRRQWRGYAAGRAWLGRRYDGFAPQPALWRVAGNTVRRAGSRAPDPPGSPPLPPRHERQGDNDRQVKANSQPTSVAAHDRVLFPALDAILGVEELIGFTLSNRPAAPPPGDVWPAQGVVVADRFPAERTDAAVGLAHPGPVRIEAGGRADRAAELPPDVTVRYREDDGPVDRTRALATLVGRGPGRMLAAAARDAGAPSLAVLAPAARRLLAEPAATLGALSDDPVGQATARRLGRMAGRELPHRAASGIRRACAARLAGWREMLTKRAGSPNRGATEGDDECTPRR
jgi:Glycosyl transferase family group 2